MTTQSHLSYSSVAKNVARYTLLPGFLPRLADFIPQLGILAYFMAIVFENVRLIPKNHPVTHPSNFGKYRVRDILALAANSLKGGLKNADQYLIFGVFLIGTILLALQFVILGALIITSTAQAATIPFVNMFTTVYPQTDIAHLMLDKVFGIPQFFNSCFDPAMNASAGALCNGYLAPVTFPTTFQMGLQHLFRFYSFGMLAVAGFVLFYYIFAMLAETVNTGVPFGKRFQSIYSPLRLVIAVLLLLPLSYGYNTGQYVVLWAAKYGSAFATNAWWLFNLNAGDNPLGLQPQEMISRPKPQDIESILNFFYLVHTCKAAYKIGQDIDIKPYFVRQAGSVGGASTSQNVGTSTTFNDGMLFYDQGDISVVFGEEDPKHTNYPANVKPYCGSIGYPTLSKNVNGVTDIYDLYFSFIMALWDDTDLSAYGTKMACNLKFQGLDKSQCNSAASPSVGWGAPNDAPAGQDFYVNMRLNTQANYTAQMDSQIITLRSTTNPYLIMDMDTVMHGWGGAGLWFNKIATFNGAFVDALLNMPMPLEYPMVMAHVAKKKMAFEKSPDANEMYSPQTSSGGKTITMDRQMDDSGTGDPAMGSEIASLLAATYDDVQNSDITSKPKVSNANSAVKNFVSVLFGHNGLFDFRSNGEVFPLAKLSMLGREIIDKTIIMFATGGIVSGLGGLASQTGGPAEILGDLGKSMISFASIGITTGVLLYYITPFMPFLYFFFAVGRWVKSIFEAMVAIPLWALAHMKLGGEGIPGPGGIAGYFLILEILLRPILTLFGLLLGMGIFMALSAGLDSVFNLAIANIGGFDMTTLSSGGTDNFANSARDGMDALFYTILYAVLTYMLATSSFKLIDLFPNAIMRWGGNGVSSFNSGDDVEKQVDNVLTYKVDLIARDITSLGKSGARNMDDLTRHRDATGAS